jgi:tRNA (guanine-N7-)-methyltransferase
MENASRTAEYQARMALRRADLAADLAKILPPATRFVGEIGCGHGHFLTAYAQKHPDETCVGIDLIRERITRATRKRDRAKLNHLHFLQAEALMFLETLPPGAQFSKIFVLFPDPWPKKRHHKNRLLQTDFLTVLAKYAGQGTRLYFRTDHEPYFEAVEATINDHAAWIISEEPWPFEEKTVFQARAQSYRSLVARPAQNHVHH